MLHIVFSVILSFCLLSGFRNVNAQALSIYNEGERTFFYSVTNQEITIEAFTTTEGSVDGRLDLALPRIIEGLPVRRVARGFQQSYPIRSLSLPDTVTVIDESLFTHWFSLESIVIDPANSVYSSDHGVLLNKAQTVLMTYPINKPDLLYTIPETVTEISPLAFSEVKNLSRLLLPTGLTSIGYSAFSECSDLTDVGAIPAGMVEIPQGAFNKCSSLTNLTLHDGILSIGSGAFSECHQLRGMKLPAALTNIGPATFFNCRALTNIVLPQNTAAIGWWAFQGCSGLTNLELNSSLGLIEERAFLGCSNLTSVTLPPSLIAGDNIFEKCGLKNLTIKCSTVPYGAFRFCAALTNVVLPANLLSIAPGGFLGCSNLAAINLPESLTSIGGGAFYSCVNLKSLTIPPAVTNVGVGTFTDCRSLANVTLPPNLHVIEDGTFQSCAALTNISIPETVTSIGKDAFLGCARLPRVIIPDSVTNINDQAFFACTDLTDLRIGAGVESIGARAFNYCYSLPSLTLGINVRTIGDSAFYWCRSLTQLSIPNSVTTVGGASFSECTGLTNVSISAQVIGGYAFAGCTNLRSLNIQPGVSTIQARAFLGCAMSRAFVPATVTDIAFDPFGQSPALQAIEVDPSNPYYTDDDGVLFNKSKSILIQYPAGKQEAGYRVPESVSTIEMAAFSGSRLTRITIPGTVNAVRAEALLIPFLKGVYFQGDAPPQDFRPFGMAVATTVYYLPGASGWNSTFDGATTAVWQPQVLAAESEFGVQSGRFAFSLKSNSSRPVVIEAIANLQGTNWTPVSTNSLDSSWEATFADPFPAADPTRFYRLRPL